MRRAASGWASRSGRTARLTFWQGDRELVATAFPREHGVQQGTVVESKRLSETLEIIKTRQRARADAAIAKPTTTLRKARLLPNAGKPDEWRAGDVRGFFTRLREICPTSLTTNHVRKSDGAGRDSGDLHAAVDLIIELRDEDSKRHYTAPELNDRRRTLHYAGRILHGRVTHCQMGDDFGFTVVDGHGAPSTGGGGGKVDPFTVGEPADPLDEKITGYLMAHPEGVSQNAVQKAVGGRRPGMVRRLKVVGTLCTDKLWRCDTGRKAVLPEHELSTPSPPPEQVRPDAPPPPVGTRDAVGCVPVSPANGTQGGTQCVPASHPIRDAPSGRTSGTHLGTHLAVPDLLALAGAKTDTPSTPRGGSGEDTPIGVSSIPAPPGGEPAEKGDAHDSACPGGCGGTGSVNGKACDWGNYLEDRKRRLRGVQVRWDAGQAPPDGADRCAICGRWDGKTIDYDDGSYTVKIPRGDDTCVRCQAHIMARMAGQLMPSVRDHEACWTARETVH